MCNLYRLQAPRAAIAELFSAADEWQADAEKDYVSPGRPGPVVLQREGSRRLVEMAWGFPPPAGVKAPVVNVRNYGSPFWRSALANPERRCLVPVTSFQEWSVEPDPTTGKKRPYWFSVPSRPIFGFAGVWRPTDNGPRFAFLTCGYDGEAQSHVVGAIHPKAIPVILHDEDYDRWLRAPVEDALSLACAFPSQLMAKG
jgi:putative SOS response-associated peptidase YedK